MERSARAEVKLRIKALEYGKQQAAAPRSTHTSDSAARIG
jgi:hypothetical protein